MFKNELLIFEIFLIKFQSSNRPVGMYELATRKRLHGMATEKVDSFGMFQQSRLF